MYAVRMALPVHDLDVAGRASRREYLLTNGLGGFAMGCADAVNRRRYHALLVGATRPPVGRVAALSAIADTLAIETDGGGVNRYPLTEFAFAGWSGRTGAFPARFATDGVSAAWTYTPRGEVAVTRTLTLADGRNAATVEYHVVSPWRSWIEARPLVALRDFHDLNRGDGVRWRYVTTSTEGGATVHAGRWSLRLATTAGQFSLHPDWWWNFEYDLDLARGQDGHEDLYTPGVFLFECPAGSSRHELAAWMDDGPWPVALAEPKRRRLATIVGRVSATVEDADRAGALATLAVASDQFVVARDHATLGRQTTIIAGYPWFGDWGRDTMIALPGLLLTTGRLAEAGSVLRTFAAMRRDGLVPNCFDDASGEATYNTVDASLWFIQAAFEYAAASGDRATFRRDLLPACEAILRAYRDGTAFGIRMDDADHLIAAGSPATQLTWMDAARDGVVFTPRHGKPVEVNALWVSALHLVSSDPDARGTAWRDLAHAARASFHAAFWNKAEDSLFDRLEQAPGGGWRGVAECRPNQIYAVALPGVDLPVPRARAIVRAVRERLLTPAGLRTLAPGHPSYRPRYEGNLFQRDGAYHNGTAWPYLLGTYARALRAAGESAAAADIARTLLRDMLGDGQPDAALATIAEVYDAEEPRRPGGCPAQAWSVAEVLRTLLGAA